MDTSVYTFRSGTSADIGRVWPLVQARLPGVDYLCWQRFAAPLAHGDSRAENGIVLAERAGAVRGLFAFRRVPDLAADGLLLVRPVLLLEMINADGLWHALQDAMADVAARLDCAATCMPAARGEEPLAATLAYNHPKLAI